MRTIVITGPESTGKTLISEYLSGRLGCPWIPEYARDYIGQLNRPYVYEDLVHIAENQVNHKNEIEKTGASMVILDTWLIITKVWFLEAFKRYPENLNSLISNNKIDLYIICKPDIPWVPDPLRENGGQKRDYLMNRYIEEITATGSEYTIIGGEGEERFINAFNAVISKI